MFACCAYWGTITSVVGCRRNVPVKGSVTAVPPAVDIRGACHHATQQATESNRHACSMYTKLNGASLREHPHAPCNSFAYEKPVSTVRDPSENPTLPGCSCGTNGGT